MKANRKLGNIGGWQDRHDSAIDYPTGFEKPIVDMLKGWRDYAVAHTRIARDSRIGPSHRID
jgi:hypothetical protein